MKKLIILTVAFFYFATNISAQNEFEIKKIESDTNSYMTKKSYKFIAYGLLKQNTIIQTFQIKTKKGEITKVSEKPIGKPYIPEQMMYFWVLTIFTRPLRKIFSINIKNREEGMLVMISMSISIIPIMIFFDLLIMEENIIATLIVFLMSVLLASTTGRFFSILIESISLNHALKMTGISAIIGVSMVWFIGIGITTGYWLPLIINIFIFFIVNFLFYENKKNQSLLPSN